MADSLILDPWVHSVSDRRLSSGSGSHSRLSQLGVNLLQPEGIATAYLSALQHRGINSNVSSVVLGCCAQDAIVLREIALRQRSHHAAGARPGDAQPHIPDRERLPDPGILHEILVVIRGLYHDVWAKPPNLETPIWIQRAQAIERGCGQQMHHSTIEKTYPRANRSQ